MDVSIGSLFATAYVARPSSISTMNWTRFSFDFTVASAGTYDLLFQSTSIGGGGGCGGDASCFGLVLDNVAITAAIPEPEIYAMMGLGLGLMGWAGRRRKPKAV